MSYSLSTPSIGRGKPAEDLSLQGEITQAYSGDLTFQDPVNFQVLWKESVCIFGATCNCQGLSWHFIYFIFA